MFRLNGFMRDPKSVAPQSLLEVCLYQYRAFDIPSTEELTKYNIVFSTCMSAGYLTSLGIPSTHFTHIFVDEAGEATEPETLIPIQLANANTSLVLAGDHLQLGPVVRSSTALQWKYDRSLMEHILHLFPTKTFCKLLRSYRAHPELMKLYSMLFYEGKLINCTNLEEATSLLKWKELPNPLIPLMFIHMDGEEGRDKDSPSWHNLSEKDKVVEIIENLLDDRTLKLVPSDIGVITPYRKQVQKISQLVHSRQLSKEITVGTVEKFQGQERRVIILSLVRSRAINLPHDSKFKLGFCDNPKRLNVAISRAKQLLIIIGNGELFGNNDPHWAKLLSHFKRHNLFKGDTPKWRYNENNTSSIPPPPPTPIVLDINDDQGWSADNVL
jgi:helicase MOV-10